MILSQNDARNAGSAFPWQEQLWCRGVLRFEAAFASAKQHAVMKQKWVKNAWQCLKDLKDLKSGFFRFFGFFDAIQCKTWEL